MKFFLIISFLAFSLAGCNRSTDQGAVKSEQATALVKADVKTLIGVQLWSFQAQVQEDPQAMFKMVREMGFTEVETAGLYKMPAESFGQAIKDAGLRVTSMHVSYGEMKNEMPTVIANAKTLGANYVGIAWYPHEGGFSEATARRAIADFNAFGKVLKEAGLKFFYHNHGYEPVPYKGETLLDLIIDETDPELVYFEMDVLWTWLPDVDPVELIKRHPGRFKLMHIKDMKKGIARGSLKGGLPKADKAVIGQGQVDWPVLLKVAKADGFEHYYLEEESTDPVGNAPKSLAYLKELDF